MREPREASPGTQPGTQRLDVSVSAIPPCYSPRLGASVCVSRLTKLRAYFTLLNDQELGQTLVMVPWHHVSLCQPDGVQASLHQHRRHGFSSRGGAAAPSHRASNTPQQVRFALTTTEGTAKSPRENVGPAGRAMWKGTEHPLHGDPALNHNRDAQTLVTAFHTNRIVS